MKPVGVRCGRPHVVQRPLVAPTVVGRRCALQGLLAAYLLAPSLLSPAQAERDPEALAQLAFDLFQGNLAQRHKALETLIASGRADVAPIIILALRFARGTFEENLLAALQKLTGVNAGDDWADWMRWQEAHPETGVIPGFAKLQARVYDLIDQIVDARLQLGEARNHAGLGMRLLPAHPIGPVVAGVDPGQLLQGREQVLLERPACKPQRQDDDRRHIGPPARDQRLECFVPLGQIALEQVEGQLGERFRIALGLRRRQEARGKEIRRKQPLQCAPPANHRRRNQRSLHYVRPSAPDTDRLHDGSPYFFISSFFISSFFIASFFISSFFMSSFFIASFFMSSLAIVSFLSCAKVCGANRRPSDRAVAEIASMTLRRFIGRFSLTMYASVKGRLPP